MQPPKIDLVGEKFGRLTVANYVGHGKWLCRCECGGTAVCVTTNLKKGNSTSCGCRRSDSLFRHGLSTHPQYTSWRQMRQRCQNPNDRAYANYGGRGISVCERWQTFENFFIDMGIRPKGFELDRIDNDGNYEPSNCRWVRKKVNLNNRRNNRFVTWQGKTLTVTAWAEALGVNHRTLANRIGRGWSLERAMSRPVRRHPR